MELFNFFRTVTLLISTVASSITFTLGELNQYIPPQPSITAEEYIPTKQTPVDQREINTQAIVGILCAFVNVNPQSKKYDELKYQRGSGVIINYDGFILANRNVADPGFYNPEEWQEYKFLGCQAGPAPKEYRIPGDQELKTISPFIQVPVLSYVIEPVFAPYEVLISDYENDWLDFAFFLVTDLNPDAKFFGINSLPKKFPYIPILLSETPTIKESIVSFGYPTGTSIGLRSAINTIFIQGLLSHVTKLWTGDERFQNELFLLQSELDSEGTAEGGRFGSPIFWKGYLVGIHIFKQDRSLNIYNLGIQSIVDVLESNGIAMFDEIY